MSESPKYNPFDKPPKEHITFKLAEYEGRKCLIIYDAMGDEEPNFSKRESRMRVDLNPFIDDETRAEIIKEIDALSESDLKEI